VGKSCVPKAVISPKRVKIGEKLLWTAYRNSLTLFRTVPFRPPTASSYQKGGTQPHQKLQSLLSQEQVKLYRFQIWQVRSQGPSEKSPLKIWEKTERGRIHGLPKFLGYPLLSQERVKLTNFKFGKHIHRINRNETH